MAQRPTLYAEVYVTYERRNREFEVTVDAEFTTDGEDIIITKWTAQGGNAWDIETEWFDDLVYDAVCAVADDKWQDYLDDQGEYLVGQREAA